MNKFKISNLYIKNFKCITEADFNFDGKHLVVYDGPNGYGKTTCFEAIEILFAGNPRKSKTSFVDKRYKFRDSPIHKYNEQEIIISAVLTDNDGNTIKIKRVFPTASSSSSADNNFGKIFTLSKLYVNDNQEPAAIEDVEAMLQFENVESLFNLLNYVEQDENTYFLKRDPKNRYSTLESLLGGEEERLLLAKVNDAKDQIKKKTKVYSDEISLLEKNNLSAVTNTLSDIKYIKLVKNKDFEWDREEVKNTDPDIQQQYLLELNKLDYLSANREEVKKVLANHSISYFINTNASDHLLRYFWSVNNFGLLKIEDERKREIRNIIKRNTGILEFIEKLDFKNLSEEAEIDFLSKKIGLVEYIPSFRSSLRTILSMERNLSADNRILSDLKEKRAQLLQINTQYSEVIPIKDSECPTCGYDWHSSLELIKHIEDTETKIFAGYLENNAAFELTKKDFTESILDKVSTYLMTELQSLEVEVNNLIDNGFFAELLDYVGKREEFEAFVNLFENKVKEQILDIINHRTLEDIVSAKDTLLKLVSESRPTIDETVDQAAIRNDFSYFFGNSFSELDEISPENISDKRKYLNWRFYNAISHNITLRKNKIEKLDIAWKKLYQLSQSMDAQINIYTNSIVEKIKIPFHIYTGKILQNHSLGSGLNIDFEMEKKDKQLYITPCYKDQEVAFTLSSGQLSATVISLMLVLNKVFNQSQLGMIFIDDPLQTLDEINAHSLVELLKYNFADQQIVLSTHEDKYSRFLRYKFDKFGLSNKNINMRDWQ
ncbi:AAA family ATPase [Chryseobacterium sp. CBSDS_008]|uniref:AAA family ATPase n=1 Tax=Chryseobacterium sp. CBSDS_008 TaxID=3415265 RepID=UPI003CEACCA0